MNPKYFKQTETNLRPQLTRQETKSKMFVGGFA